MMDADDELSGQQRALLSTSSTSVIQFSEAGAAWQALPEWVRFLISYGFSSSRSGADPRRISVISMPCESAGAGLVALGALRHRLTSPDALDSISHYKRLERLAKVPGGHTYVRHNTLRGRYVLEPEGGILWARRETSRGFDRFSQSEPGRRAILAHSANSWHVEDEPAVEVLQGAELPYGPIYERLLGDGAPIVGANLARSDSAICLAGRVAGSSVSRGLIGMVRFRVHGCEAALDRLLTVHEWCPETVSRVTLFNSRTARLDRNNGLTRLVIADGDAAFLKVVDAPEFSECDVIGVMHRAVDRDRLESVGAKLADLTQWYEPDPQFLASTGCPPVGMTLTTLRHR